MRFVARRCHCKYSHCFLSMPLNIQHDFRPRELFRGHFVPTMLRFAPDVVAISGDDDCARCGCNFWRRRLRQMWLQFLETTIAPDVVAISGDDDCSRCLIIFPIFLSAKISTVLPLEKSLANDATKCKIYHFSSITKKTYSVLLVTITPCFKTTAAMWQTANALTCVKNIFVR